MLRSRRALSIPALLALVALAGGCVTSGPSPAEQRAEEEKRVKQGAQAKYNMAIDHLRSGRNGLALRELMTAEEMDPSDKWIQLAMGEAYRRVDRPEDAIVHLEKALALDPAWHSARLNLSGVYIQMGRHEEAAQHAQLLVDDPTFDAPWRGLTNLGWAQHRVGRKEEARGNLALAIEYNERYWPALLNLGILEAEEGRQVEAMALFQEVLDLEPEPLVQAEAHYRMGQIFIALGQQEKALPHFVASAEVKPKGQWGKKSEEYLKLLR